MAKYWISSTTWSRRWLPILLCFPDNQQLLDLVEDVAEVVDDIQDQNYPEPEPDLVVDPQSPFDRYMQEIRECREYKENHPEIWQMIFKKKVDAETYAFCLLPDEIRQKLVN